jgi:SAM-dependent methyltransferase
MATDRTALNRAAYEQIAGLYAHRQTAMRDAGTSGQWVAPLEEAFLAALAGRGRPAAARVADLGCGPATDGARFAAAGHVVVGLDLSPAMLSFAAAALPGRVAQADLRALPLATSTLDGIWCSAALLHVPEPMTVQVLNGFRRVLRPDGVLALVTAAGEGDRLEPVPYAPEVDRWFVYRDPGRLREQVTTAGFQVELTAEVTSNRLWTMLLASAKVLG